MIFVKVDLLDGRGLIDVVVNDRFAAERLEHMTRKFDEYYNDAMRWREVESHMTHERSGPNVGWTIGSLVFEGYSPAEAVDAAIERREREET